MRTIENASRRRCGPVTGSTRMLQQYKKIAFLAPRNGMNDAVFRRYWREIHGPIGQGFNFAGMAEFWLPSDNADEFVSTQIYCDRIRVDE